MLRRIGNPQRRWFTIAFAVFALVTLSVTGQLAAASGNSPVFNISSDSAASSYGQVAVSGSHVYVVWVSVGTSGSSEILFRTSPDFGATWSHVSNLSNDASKSFEPRVRVSGVNVYVMWTDNATGNYEVMMRVSRDYGATWGPGTDISATSGPSRHARILVNGSSVYVAWVEKLSGTNVVLFQTSHDNATTWAAATSLSNDVNDSDNIHMQTYLGYIFVVWQSNNPSHFQVLFRASPTSGASWAPTVAVSNSVGNATQPDLAVQTGPAGGNVYVVWRDDSGGNKEILFRASHDNGVTWGGAANLSQSPGASTSPGLGTVGFGSSNSVYVIWTESSQGNTEVNLRVSSDAGNSFRAALDVSQSPGASTGAKLLVLPHTILISWIDSTPGTKDTFLATSANFGVSFAQQDLSIDLGDSIQVALSSGGTLQGTTYVVWTDNATRNGDIYLVRLVATAASVCSAATCMLRPA